MKIDYKKYGTKAYYGMKEITKALIIVLAAMGLSGVLKRATTPTPGEVAEQPYDIKECKDNLEALIKKDAKLGVTLNNFNYFPAGTTDIEIVGKGWFKFKYYGKCVLLYDVQGATALTLLPNCVMEKE